jgi:hypothetical protein
MTKYLVWYAKEHVGQEQFDVTAWNIKETHRPLAVVEANNIDDVYNRMQGENWSPNGEARELILALGLTHTSMSVGDVVQEFEYPCFLMVANHGWWTLENN